MKTPDAPLSRLASEAGSLRPSIDAETADSSTQRSVLSPTTSHAPDEITDEVLMQQYLAGSNAAFDRLYARHRESLYRLLMRLLPRRAAADEVFQDVWLRVVSNRASWQPSMPFRAWLLRIARNRAIDTLRQTRPEQSGEASEIWIDAAADTGPTPDIALSRFESARRLELALAALPDAQREAFLLRAEMGLGHDEIAELTGVRTETAKSRLRYAYARLREVLSA